MNLKMIWGDAKPETLAEYHEYLETVFQRTNDCLETCKSIIDNDLGRLATRIEHQDQLITDEDLNSANCHMEKYEQSNFLYPVMSNGTLLTWRHGFRPLYTHVNGNYVYSGYAKNDGIIIDERNPHYYKFELVECDRDFLAMDMQKECVDFADAFNQCLKALEMITQRFGNIIG